MIYVCIYIYTYISNSQLSLKNNEYGDLFFTVFICGYPKGKVEHYFFSENRLNFFTYEVNIYIFKH